MTRLRRREPCFDVEQLEFMEELLKLPGPFSAHFRAVAGRMGLSPAELYSWTMGWLLDHAPHEDASGAPYDIVRSLHRDVFEAAALLFLTRWKEARGLLRSVMRRLADVSEEEGANNTERRNTEQPQVVRFRERERVGLQIQGAQPLDGREVTEPHTVWLRALTADRSYAAFAVLGEHGTSSQDMAPRCEICGFEGRVELVAQQSRANIAVRCHNCTSTTPTKSIFAKPGDVVVLCDRPAVPSTRNG